MSGRGDQRYTRTRTACCEPFCCRELTASVEVLPRIRFEVGNISYAPSRRRPDGAGSLTALGNRPGQHSPQPAHVEARLLCLCAAIVVRRAAWAASYPTSVVVGEAGYRAAHLRLGPALSGAHMVTSFS